MPKLAAWVVTQIDQYPGSPAVASTWGIGYPTEDEAHAGIGSYVEAEALELGMDPATTKLTWDGSRLAWVEWEGVQTAFRVTPVWV